MHLILGICLRMQACACIHTNDGLLSHDNEPYTQHIHTHTNTHRYGDMENADMMVGHGFIMRPNLFDVSLPFPEWVPGLPVQHARFHRQIRVSHVAPGALPERLARFLNVTIPEGGKDALRSAMDELFDAAVVHVPLEDEIDPEIEQVCQRNKKKCKRAAQLVRDARYTAKLVNLKLTVDAHEDIAKAWEAVRSAVIVPPKSTDANSTDTTQA
jgi:hypothetical protein